jgi:pseudouridine-5'-phosphate glycosidase
MSSLQGVLQPGRAVQQALDAGVPVVALESTIITHGLPIPASLETARAVEQAVREAGATPATIAVLSGRLRVGLDESELEHLARLGPRAGKCSRRDLARDLAAGADAGTTVSATMLAAAAAGIRVFATGGIGGVHRGVGLSLDISADLQELAHTPVAVVCAGPKAILDLGLTLEYLETMGVPVLGFGCEQLPAFWCRDSGFPLDARYDSVAALAGVLRLHWLLPRAGGVVIANPVPEGQALPRETVEGWIDTALADAAGSGISGKAVTPYLLQAIEKLSDGASLASNRELLLNNARLGAVLACELARELGASTQPPTGAGGQHL